MKARDNPFSTSRVLRVRYQMGRDDWNRLLKRLEGLGYRGAIIGAHGAGKTTLLEDLDPLLVARGFRTHLLRLNEDQRWFDPGVIADVIQPLGPGDLLLIDGAEQLSRLRWWRLLRWTRGLGGLLITAHAPGLLPTLHECRTSPSLLDHLIKCLVPEPGPELTSLLHPLYDKHHGNLRDVFRELYDRWGRPLNQSSTQGRTPVRL